VQPRADGKDALEVAAGEENRRSRLYAGEHPHIPGDAGGHFGGQIDREIAADREVGGRPVNLDVVRKCIEERRPDAEQVVDIDERVRADPERNAVIV